MKTIQTSVIIYLIGIFSQITIDAQQQNPIKSYNGIPIITYVRGVDSVQSYYYIPPQQYDTIINSGVKFIQVENMTTSEYYSHLEGKEVFILPEQYFIGQNTTDKYITYYTEGRYSEWPTVGTDSLDGKATLKSLETHTEKYGGLLRTLQTNGTPLSHDTIVYGPQYWQDVYYRFHNDQDTIIRYKVSYKLKLEQLIPSEYLSTDTVCILQVTAKDTYNRVFTTGLPVYVIKEKAVTVGELLPFNTTKTFEMTYTLENVPDSISDQPIVGNTFPNWQKNIAGTKNLWAAVKNIEFRIVWKSNSELFRLYMDTIKVYDDRGWEIINRSEMQQKIINQVTQAPYKSKAAGWMSVDEPVSIDQMAPIRKVSELIESVSPNTGLWINYNAGWNGRFGDAADPGYTMSLERIDEFMRRVKKANLWVVLNPFDWPYCPDSIPNAIEINLGIIDSILSKLAKSGNKYDNLYYGLCYQTGNYYAPNTSQQCSREITDYEFLYLSNLALLYGSKVLTPWLWFGSDVYYTGIVNANESGFVTTDKYYVIKNTLTPRLSGLMGKTLKRLKPLSQFVADNAMKYPYNTPQNYINKLILTTQTQITPPIFDIGFHNEPNVEPTGDEKRYFMLIDRYYPNRSYDTIKIKIEFKNLFKYRNWKFINYCDSTSYSIIADGNDKGLTEEIRITKGDGYLLGLHPAVISGGELRTDEIINSNISLEEDLRLLNNSNIFIARNKYYTIKDTIELAGNGYIFGAGYIHLTNTGEIITNSWTRSLYKGRSGNNPRIIWSKYPHSNQIVGYKVYRKIGEGAFSHIATVSAASPRQYIDYGRQINDNPPKNNPNFVEYRVRAVYIENGQNVESVDSNPVRYDTIEEQFAIDKRAIEGLKEISYSLEQNYPNPFNPVTRIRYSVGGKGKSQTTIKIYDIIGREVVELLNEEKESGEYEIELDANKYKLTSGVYIYKMQSGGFSDIKKLLIVK